MVTACFSWMQSDDTGIKKNPKTIDLTSVSGLLWFSSNLVVVETAGIEPASASPLPLALHVYSDFNLTGCYPPDREDKQLFRYFFSASAPNKPPSRFYESDARMFTDTRGRL